MAAPSRDGGKTVSDTETEFLDRAALRICETASGVIFEAAKRQLIGASFGTDSPIERLLFASIKFSTDILCAPGFPISFRYLESGADLIAPPREEAVIGRQVKFAGVRVDFLVRVGSRILVVECDGHEFHERTPEQAERDRSRDRAFQEFGATVFRFTGREIWRDPIGCAEQIFRWIVASRKAEK